MASPLNRRTSFIMAAVGAAMLISTPVLAQQTSGGASGGGADQGGSGAPGGGTGLPGAVAKGRTASGIGTSATVRAGGARHRHTHRHHRM